MYCGIEEAFPIIENLNSIKFRNALLMTIIYILTSVIRCRCTIKYNSTKAKY